MIAEIGILFALYASVRMVDMLVTHQHKAASVRVLVTLCAVVLWFVAALVAFDLLMRGASAPMP